MSHPIEALLRQGEFIQALERTRAGLGTAPGDPALTLQRSRALLGLGATQEARRALLSLLRRDRGSEEALGLLGRVWKDLWETAATPAARTRALARSLACYRRTFERTGSTWAGINAATLAWVSGRQDEAQALARRVRASCLETLDQAPPAEAYWPLATLGEAALLLGHPDEALTCYARAAALGRGRWWDLASTARSLELLMAHLGVEDPRLRACLPTARILAWAAGAALPPGLDPVTLAEAVVTVAGAGDVACLEVLAAAAVPVQVVLPCGREALLDQAEAWGPGWRPRLAAALADPAQVLELSARARAMTALDLAFARDYGLGLARLRAAQLRGTVLPAEAGAPGSTEPSARRLGAILFADLSNYSALAEDQVPSFVAHFLGGVSRLLADLGPPLARNTWGDALYFVYPELATAGRLALRLQAFVAGTPWAELGLPPLGIRISLHAGPVTVCEDPVTGAPAATGTHAVLGARLEPVTPVGQIYATQAFAALLLATGDRSLALEPQGQVPLAKGAGTMPVYRVRSGRAAHDPDGSATFVTRSPDHART
jgi:tetratricopeptide (TPR) repeat protein